jgi:hypothetical protein
MYYGISQGASVGVGAVAGLAMFSANVRLPFAAAFVLLLVTMVLMAWLLPESLPAGPRRTRFQLAEGNPINGLTMACKRDRFFGRLLLSFTLAQVGGLFLPNTWVNFTDAAFGWDFQLAGASIVVYGALLAPIPRFLIARLGEIKAMLLGLQLMAAGFAFFALISLGGPAWSWLVWPTVVWMCCGMMFDSAMRTFITRQARAAPPPAGSRDRRPDLASPTALGLGPPRLRCGGYRWCNRSKARCRGRSRRYHC